MAGGLKTGFEGSGPKVSSGVGGKLSTGFESNVTSAVVPSGPVRAGGIAGGPATAAMRKGGGGGGVGGLFGWLGSKASLAGHDLAQMPGGFLQVGKAAAHDAAKLATHVPGGNSPSARRAGKGKYELPGVGKAFLKSTEETIKHPLRDPFATGLTVAPALGAIGRVGEAGLAARAADVAAGESRIGEAAKALVRTHGNQPARVLKSGGRVVKKDGVTMRIGGSRDVNLIPSRNAGKRFFIERPYDRAVQKAMDKQAQAEGVNRAVGRIAEHGKKRVAGALAEEQRAVQRMNAIPADKLERAALRLSKLPLKMGGKLHSAASELTSTQTPPEVAAAYHEAQALKLGKQAAAASGKEAEHLAEAAKRNESAAELYRKVHENDLVHVDLSRPDGQKVFINPGKARLAAADAALEHAGNVNEQAIRENNLMSPQGQQAAINNPGLVRAGAEHVNPTPGKLGVESHILKEARSQVAKLEKLHARTVLKSLGDTRRNTVISQSTHLQLPWENDPRVMRISGALSVAKDRLQKLEAAHENRIEPTGFVGGESALPGRTHISYRSSEKAGEPGVLSAAQRKQIGNPASPISKTQRFTGENIAQGKIPKNVFLSTAKHTRQIAKFKNTLSLRRAIWESDMSPLKRSKDDILMRAPGKEAKPLSEQMHLALGDVHAALHDHASLEEIHAGTQEGLAALHQWLNQHILDQADASKAHAIGTRAQEGYGWVNRHLAEQLQKDAAPRATGVRTLPGKLMDNTNAAVTALTVYFKLGHAFTRVFTNAATNIMQGSLRPDQYAKNLGLWRSLSKAEQDRLVAAAGQQGFAALPVEAGTEGPISRAVAGAARGGARVWAQYADRYFRANSLMYELRKIGYDTPESVSKALDAIQQSGHGMPAHEWSKVSAAFRRADREAISYDRLNESEKKYLARAIWFYPWVKGSTAFTMRSIIEHPWKMAASGQAGVVGRKEQLKMLGPVPSYEQGLIDVGGNQKNNPYTVDMNTFSPVGTAGQLLNVPQTHGALAGQLNPVAGSLVGLATGTNSYGEPSNNPYMDALQNLLSSTPESQLYEAAHRGSGKKQAGRMFPATSWQSSLLRYGLGPGLARRPTNKAALAKAAAREHAKRYTVYGK